jgi:hypothetical protein
MQKSIMKISLLFISFVFLFSNSFSKTQIKTENNYFHFTGNEISVKAWVLSRGEWIQGFLFLNNGAVTRCQFPNIGNYGNVSINAQIYQPTNPVRLNPNNQLAIDNSFTHYIDIPNYGRAYFIYSEQSQNQYSNQNSSYGQYSQTEKSIRAYVQIQGQWVEGFLFISNGLVTRCQFPNMMEIIGRDIRAQIYQPTNPTRLNPNSQLAISNNFTHFIDIPNYGRAFFSY